MVPLPSNLSIDWEGIAKIGVPAVIALYLVYRLSNGLDSVADELRLRAQEHISQNANIDSIKQITGQSDMAQQQILYVLQTLCVNGARTDSQRADCLRTGTRARMGEP